MKAPPNSRSYLSKFPRGKISIAIYFASSILTFLIHNPALPHSPAEYQIYCNSQSIYIATVNSSASLDCRLRAASSCQPSGLVNLTVTPTRLLWGMPVPIGDPEYIETTMMTSTSQHTSTSPSGFLIIPAHNTAISNQMLSKSLNGKTIVVGHRTFTKETGRYFSYIWPAQAETYILNSTQTLCTK